MSSEKRAAPSTGGEADKQQRKKRKTWKGERLRRDIDRYKKEKASADGTAPKPVITELYNSVSSSALHEKCKI